VLPETPAPQGVLAETSPTSRSLGFYIHVPFCTERCPFCSFNTAPFDAGATRRFLAALEGELDLLSALDWAPAVTVSTVFMGGGTPSLLDPEAVAAVLARLRAGFRLADDAEITIECNPESVGPQKLAGYRAAGVTRISLGVQTLEDALLPRLGRLHTAADARAAFAAARAAGCDNVSIDLMYGLPALDLSGWMRTLQAVLDWGPDHLSAYALTLDGGSLWGATGLEGLPAEDLVIAQYWALAEAATAGGFEHYEVSNYARPGFRSRHNQIYWRAAEYLAAGPGACGFVGDVRYANLKPVPRYCASLEAGRLPLDGVERLTSRQRLSERLFLGLRTSDGVPADWLAERLMGDAALHRRVASWETAGLLRRDGDRLRLTEAGFLVSDDLFVSLL
jgi:oxygen-independent coproporphyrinogen-3 oxidase